MNAAIYARYSSHSQQEQSIEGQLRDAYAFAEREGYKVVGEYCDRAISGRTDDRPQFQKMIADAAKKQFQVVIVWKLDRFARNRYDSATYKARLKKHGVRVISATENITDDPEGIILEGLLESMAEYYSANLSKHVRRGLRESVINGTWTGGAAPFGYKVVDKKLVVDEDKATAIRYAFRQYAAGVPKKKILDELNAKGYRNQKGTAVSKGYSRTRPTSAPGSTMARRWSVPESLMIPHSKRFRSGLQPSREPRLNPRQTWSICFAEKRSVVTVELRW